MPGKASVAGLGWSLALLAILPFGVSARAEMVLSHVVVDLRPGQPPRDDIEVHNSGADRLFVVAEPSEILNPGTPSQQRVADPDPAVSGLLVSPQKMVLEPGERKLIRIASVGAKSDHERVYRVTVKPVAGELSAPNTAVKVFVGYDVLVIRRPQVVTPKVVAEHLEAAVRLRNVGNTAVELFDGQQCDSAGERCAALPATRLYSQATFDVPVRYATPIRYKVLDGQTTRSFQF
jgi:P pilus assembly chaperone PapD